MSFHVVAYYNSNLAAVANTDAPALADGIVIVQNNHFLFQQDVNLLWAYSGSATQVRARITSPTLRQVSQQYIRPITGGLLPGNNQNIAWYGNKTFRLKGLEEIAVEQTATGAGEHAYAILGVSDVLKPAPVGDVYNLRFTSTGTAVASAWTLIALVFEAQLPAGVYSCVGGEIFSTSMIAFRFTFDNQPFRPGFIGSAAATNREFWPLYQQRFGEWGMFRTTNLPRCEVLCNAADTSFEGYLQVVKTASL